MAVIYLRSTDGNDADSGLTWALAKATLASALTAAGAGGTVYVSDNHAETQASAMTLTSPGTAASPVRVICVDDTGDPEPPTARATTATVTTTGNSNISLGASGYAYVYGITCSVGTTAVAPVFIAEGTGGQKWVMEQCAIVFAATGACLLRVDTTDDTLQLLLINSQVRFADVGQSIRVRNGTFAMRGGSTAATGSVPTNLITTTGGDRPTILLAGVDLSTSGSGKKLLDTDYLVPVVAQLVDCKLGASVTIADRPTCHDAIIEAINCDSADTNYRFQRTNYQADETQETTIVRTGGASDGTTTFSRKVVTTANVTAHFPYESMWMEVWNETIDSAKTITVETVTDNVTLTDAEAWLEVEAVTTDGDVGPLGVFTTDRIADPIFGTPANQTSSSETWTTTGLTTPIKQKLAVTITPREKGIIRARVCVAKASTTVYYDPLLTVS